MMNRAHSLFDIKSFDDEERTFEGIATTPATDRGEDIVDPDGAVYKLPLAMMWQHGKGSIKDPVGWIVAAKKAAEGIWVRGQMAKPKADYPQSLRDELDGAWVKVRDKLVRGLSIGFRPLDAVPIKNSYGMHFKKWEWLELSPVSIPMNAEASILNVKQFDTQTLAASGNARGVRLLTTHPGASGKNAAQRGYVQLISRK